MKIDARTGKFQINALVVEGGAMRGIFSTGVLDAFLVKQFNPFDIYIGVSAGATNIAAYLAGMVQRNYKVYTDYSVRPDFINWRKFIFGGHLVDIDWLWETTIREIRLDMAEIYRVDRDFFVGVTEVSTGKAVYLKPDAQNLENVVKASSSIPVFYRKSVQIDGVSYTDGGLADPIPVREAYHRNANNIMVLRSRPHTYSMKQNSNLLSKIYLSKFPKLLEATHNRAKIYQESIGFMRNPPEGVRIKEINPPESFKTKRLTKDVSILKKDYETGFQIGLQIVDEWNVDG